MAHLQPVGRKATDGREVQSQVRPAAWLQGRKSKQEIGRCANVEIVHGPPSLSLEGIGGKCDRSRTCVLANSVLGGWLLPKQI